MSKIPLKTAKMTKIPPKNIEMAIILHETSKMTTICLKLWESLKFLKVTQKQLSSVLLEKKGILLENSSVCYYASEFVRLVVSLFYFII